MTPPQDSTAGPGTEKDDWPEISDNLRERLLHFNREAAKCARCRQCKYVTERPIPDDNAVPVCPSWQEFKFSTYSAMGRMNLMWAICDGRYRPDEEAVRLFYQCNVCGACTESCSLGSWDVREVLEEWRSVLVDMGLGPLPEHQPLIKSIESYDNPWMQPRSRRADWAKGLDVKTYPDEKAPVLLYVGCTYAFDPELRETMRHIAELLKKGGVDFFMLGKKEKTCGSTPLRIGDRKTFTKYASDNIETFNSLGIEKLITPCAGCYITISQNYKKVGELKFPVQHVIELLAELVEQGKLKPEKVVNKKVTYHDPCHLGRIAGIYDAPRKILEAIPGIELIEMYRNREHSLCCGSGGGVKTAFPDFAMETGKRRIDEAKQTNADYLVTACPFCEQHLQDAVDYTGTDMTVKDVADLLYESVMGK